MKTKHIILIVFVLLIGASIVIYFAGPSIVNNFIIVTSSDSYVRKINLSEVKTISISNDGKKYDVTEDSDEFVNVVSAFNNKKVKIKTDTTRFQEKDKFQIDIATDEKTYTLNASPILENGELQDKVEFVLYDGTNYSTMEYRYLIVEISKEDFLKIFPNTVAQIKDEQESIGDGL
jgi:hypothetical protein